MINCFKLWFFFGFSDLKDVLAPSEQFLQAQNQVFNAEDLEEDTILDVSFEFLKKLFLWDIF